MNFSLKTTCGQNCPFRTDCKSGWLGENRAQEIVDSITRDQQTFACHNTTEFDDDGDHVRTDGEQHCAGAMIMLEKINRPNQMMRIAERLGMYDHTKLTGRTKFSISRKNLLNTTL